MTLVAEPREQEPIMTLARDSRIDAFRGLALVCILVDHIPGNLLAGFTLQNFGFADAAEVLVLLAGISASAGAAARTTNPENAISLPAWALRRATKLYLAHIAVVITTLAAYALVARAFRNDALAAYANLDLLEDAHWRSLFQLLTLQLQPDYLNILPLYVCFILALPLLDCLVRWRPLVALAMSAALWFVAGHSTLNLPSLIHPTGWYFNPFAWQLLFTIGLAAWACRDKVHNWISQPLVRTAASVIVVVAVLAKAPWTQIPALSHLQFDMSWLVDQTSKTNLAWPRLLNVLALAILAYSRVSAHSLHLDGKAGRWLRLLGRHALPVYVAASLFDALTTIARLSGARGIVYQVSTNALGLTLLTLVAYALHVLAARGRVRTKLRAADFDAMGAAAWRAPALAMLVVTAVWSLNGLAEASTANAIRTPPARDAANRQANTVALGSLAGLATGAGVAGFARRRRRRTQAKLLPSAEAAALQILATASHEMRTHLAAIASASELMIEQPEAAAARARDVARSAEVLIEIATNTLNLARLDREQPRLTYAPFDLRQMLSETLDMMRIRAAARHLGLELDYGTDLPTRVVGTEVMLRQIVVNLVANAIKFTASGRVTIRVSGIASTEAAHLQIAIRDTGCGIPAEQQASIFKPFIQLDATAPDARGGLGLGLAISQRLADLLGSEITVDSRPGIGSTFAISLEFAIDRTTPAGTPTLVAVPERTVARRILIADDVETNRRLVAAMLAVEGTEVVLTSSGEEAVERTLSFVPDVILMDVSMPDMDGFEATRRIRHAERAAGRTPTPIIALTAHAMRGDKSRCLAAGMDDYLTKPVRKAALRESVERWSKVKHGAPRPEATYTGPERRQRQSAATETPVQ